MREGRLGGLAVREWGDPDEPGILLWPGLGAVAAYFAPIAESLPGRTVAVDPPGFGSSAPIDRNARDRYVELARDAIESSGCQAMIGHSLGAYVAVDVAAQPPASLRAVVLVDGGYLGKRELGQTGMPIGEGRKALVAWLEANDPRFPDWQSAISNLSAMLGTEPSPVTAAYVHEVFVEAGGEIRSAAAPDQMADLLLAIVNDDVVTPPIAVKIPTLLVACGLPGERRPTRQAAWERFAAVSPLVELHVAEEWAHNPVLSAPDAVAALITGWLKDKW